MLNLDTATREELRAEVVRLRDELKEQQVVSADLAADALLHLMEYISERQWCAGWMSGLEYMLWDWVTGESAAPAWLDEILDGAAKRLKHLSDQADGWWMWSDTAETGRVFLSLDEWRKHVEEQTNAHP